MRLKFILSIFCAFSSLHLAGQTMIFGKPLKSISFSASYDYDRLNYAVSDILTPLLRDNTELQRFDFNTNFRSKDRYGDEGRNIGLSLFLEYPREFEVGLGVRVVSGRETVNRFSSEFTRPTIDTDWGNERVFFQTQGDEVNLSLTVMKRLCLEAFTNKLGNSLINFYAGGGLNSGLLYNQTWATAGRVKKEAFAEQFIPPGFSSENNTFFDFFADFGSLPKGFAQRIFAQGAIGVTVFSRLEFGWMMRYGFTYQTLNKQGITAFYNSNAFTIKMILL